MREILAASPLIAAVRREEDLTLARESRAKVVFLLCGDINSLPRMVAALHDAGKKSFLHLDLVHGFGHDRSAMRFIASRIRPAGIITTKSHLIRMAKEEGLTCIQRLFIFDHQSLTTAFTQSRANGPAAIEVMPGVLPDWVLKQLVAEVLMPVIAGGLVRNREDAARILQAGVAAVSVGAPALWAEPLL